MLFHYSKHQISLCTTQSAQLINFHRQIPQLRSIPISSLGMRNKTKTSSHSSRIVIPPHASLSVLAAKRVNLLSSASRIALAANYVTGCASISTRLITGPGSSRQRRNAITPSARRRCQTARSLDKSTSRVYFGRRIKWVSVFSVIERRENERDTLSADNGLVVACSK